MRQMISTHLLENNKMVLPACYVWFMRPCSIQVFIRWSENKRIGVCLGKPGILLHLMWSNISGRTNYMEMCEIIGKEPIAYVLNSSNLQLCSGDFPSCLCVFTVAKWEISTIKVTRQANTTWSADEWRKYKPFPTTPALAK